MLVVEHKQSDFMIIILEITISLLVTGVASSFELFVFDYFSPTNGNKHSMIFF